MSTHCSINIQKADYVEGIYCHYDGYPKGVGSMLLNNYDTNEKVNELISLGDISYLGSNTSEDYTRSYHRWQGENIRTNKYKDKNSIIKLQYNYLWKDNRWYTCTETSDWIPLDQIILEKYSKGFYPSINEVYMPDIDFMTIDDSCPHELKKQFKLYIRLIHAALTDDGFSDYQAEDYLKRIIEDTL